MTREQLEALLIVDNEKPYANAHRLVRLHDAEQRQRIQGLEEWQRIVLGTGTDQEAVIRMSATEYTKVAMQTCEEAHEEQRQEIARLKAQLEKITGEWNEALLKLGITENTIFELRQDVAHITAQLAAEKEHS